MANASLRISASSLIAGHPVALFRSADAANSTHQAALAI
jgi:hypothetical protein